MATGDKIYTNTNRGLYFSIFLLFVVISITGYFYYQNNYILDKKLNEINSSIKESEKNLKIFNEEKQLQVYHLLRKNNRIFDLKEKYSNIPVLIEKINNFRSEYKIDFKNFNYSKGKITLKGVALSSDGEKAYEKIDDFIKYFREKNIIEGEKMKKREFKLAFIKTFNGKGSESIKFDVILEIIPKNYKLEIENKDNQKNINKINDENNQKNISNKDKQENINKKKSGLDIKKLKEKIQKIKEKNIEEKNKDK